MVKSKEDYTRAQWQIDAHAFWRSSGDRLLTKEELGEIPTNKMEKVYRKYSRANVYSYADHVELAKKMDKEMTIPRFDRIPKPDKVPVLTFPEYEGKPKRTKYGNRKIEIDGKRFDSQHEAAVYAALMSRVRTGELKAVLRQVKFDLPGGIVYIADFVTIDNEMRIEGVYDAKSEATKKIRVYINKKKQMKAIWGISIKEI